MSTMNNGRGSSWIKKVEQLIADYNLDITTYKYRSKNENFHHQLLSHNNLRIVLRKKLQTSFLEEWDVKTSSMSKLSFYRQYKQNHKLENYIVLVNNRRHRSALAKLRCSAHRLRACSHEPGTVNYPGVMIAPGQELPRVHMMIRCPGATLPRVNFIGI